MFYILDHPGNYSALKEKFCGACEAARKGQKGWGKVFSCIRSSGGGHVLMLWSQTQPRAKEGGGGMGQDPGRTEWQLRKVQSQEVKDRMILFPTLFSECSFHYLLKDFLCSMWGVCFTLSPFLSPSLSPPWCHLSYFLSNSNFIEEKVGPVWISCLLSAQSNERLGFIMKFGNSILFHKKIVFSTEIWMLPINRRHSTMVSFKQFWL